MPRFWNGDDGEGGGGKRREGEWAAGQPVRIFQFRLKERRPAQERTRREVIIDNGRKDSFFSECMFGMPVGGSRGSLKKQGCTSRLRTSPKSVESTVVALRLIGLSEYT